MKTAPLPTRPVVPLNFRELEPGEMTAPNDLIWLAGQGPFCLLSEEYFGPMYAYRPQPSPSECGHFMHIRRVGA